MTSASAAAEVKGLVWTYFGQNLVFIDKLEYFKYNSFAFIHYYEINHKEIQMANSDVSKLEDNDWINILKL